MFRAVTILAAVVVLTAYFYQRRKKLEHRKLEDAFAAQHGCEPMEKYTVGKWPLNLDIVIDILKANQRGHILQFQGRWLAKLGPDLEQRLLGDVGLVTLSPANVEAILGRQQFASFIFGQRRDAFLPQLGEGLFTQDGAPWKRSRELLRKQFARIHYSNNLSIFSDQVEHLIQRIRDLSTPPSAGEPSPSGERVIDLMPLFFNFTLDTTTHLLFGRSVRSLDENSQDIFGANFDEASWISGVRVKLIHFYWLYSPPRYFRACKKVQDYADAYIAEALSHTSTPSSTSTSTPTPTSPSTTSNPPPQDTKHDEEENPSRYDFIKTLHKELHSQSHVRDQLINVLLAGRDTTACLLSWTIRLLIRHPAILASLQSEIKSILGTDTTSEISKANIQNMPLLRAVIDETLRLYPSVPINVRTAAKASIIPTGGGKNGTSPVLVRKGMGIGYAPYFMHRRVDIYGPDAEKFKPQEWVDEPNRKEKLGWAYLPFNGGPRRCLGEEFALLETQYTVARIVQAFPALRLPEGEENVPVGEERQVLSMTLAPGDGCRVVV